ncbi:hypothetical protein B0H14DRAFT_2583121 [Mycena olivaceomarginata]|nr:hypothetical protein B0H14DRAFT_2583121 [Mycena olivaceomarginata]
MSISGVSNPLPPTKFRRVRMYHSLCPAAYNDETIHLIDNDPQCQIVICTVAFTNGINARKLLDSISLGFAKTVDIMWQEKGRVGREPGTVARGVVLVQLSSISAAIKQLDGPINPPKAPAKRFKASILKKPRAPMETVKAQFLVEKNFRSRTASPNSTTTFCKQRFSEPKKLKLKKKERELAQSSLQKFRKQLRVDEQLAGCFRHHPPSLFLPSALQDGILDRLLSFASSADLLPLLDEWYHRQTHTESLFKPDSEHEKDDHDLHDEHEPPRSESPSNDPFPAALLPKPKSRGRKRQALENIPTNTSNRRPREQLQKAAEVSKEYGPQYRPRVRR